MPQSNTQEGEGVDVSAKDLGENDGHKQDNEFTDGSQESGEFNKHVANVAVVGERKDHLGRDHASFHDRPAGAKKKTHGAPVNEGRLGVPAVLGERQRGLEHEQVGEDATCEHKSVGKPESPIELFRDRLAATSTAVKSGTRGNGARWRNRNGTVDAVGGVVEVVLIRLDESANDMIYAIEKEDGDDGPEVGAGPGAEVVDRSLRTGILIT